MGDSDEVMAFAREYKKKWNKPLIAIPTTYNLPQNHLFDIVIYANQMLRVAMRVMISYAAQKRGKMSSVEEIFKITNYDNRNSRQ